MVRSSVLCPLGARSKPAKGRKRTQPEWDEEEEWPVEAILDKRLATAEDKNAKVGDVLYLVAWEGWDSSYNSWEPYENIVDDDLISDYEKRADAAELEADDDEDQQQEEALLPLMKAPLCASQETTTTTANRVSSVPEAVDLPQVSWSTHMCSYARVALIAMFPHL